MSGLLLAALAASLCVGCSTQATVSGYEDTSGQPPAVAYAQERYDGCFWRDRLWEGDWNEKKDRRHTLKLVRARIAPWQSVAAVVTLGVWVPMYMEWELNGDRK